jgi:hypothetical protein
MRQPATCGKPAGAAGVAVATGVGLAVGVPTGAVIGGAAVVPPPPPHAVAITTTAATRLARPSETRIPLACPPWPRALREPGHLHSAAQRDAQHVSRNT